MTLSISLADKTHSARIIAAVLFWLTSAAQAAAWCATPVEGGAPQGVEIEQPYRMVREALTIPGYPWLIIKPHNRFPLHTIRNGRFEELGAEYPHAGLWSYRDHYVLGDGIVWGIRANKRSIYVLHPGQSEFEAAGVGGFLTHEYDPNRERLLLLYENQGLMEWDGKDLTPSPLAGKPLGLNDLLPRYIPDLGLYVAGTSRRLYTIAGTPPHTWQKLDLGWNRASKKVWGVRATNFRTSRSEGLTVFTHNGKHHVYDISDGKSLKRLFSIRNIGQVLVPPSGPMIYQNLSTVKARPQFVTHNGLVSVDQDMAVAPIPETGIQLGLYNSKGPLGLLRQPFVRIGDALRYYDGENFYAVPQDTTASLHGRRLWSELADRIYTNTTDGAYRLNPDLTASRLIKIEDAASFHYQSPMESATFGGIFMYGTRTGLWFVDGDQVEMVLAANESRLNRYIADIPGTKTGLILRDDGLHLLSHTCAD